MRLPPLAAVRAFEAAARLLSFTRAAEELAMTQAAVSYQIKVLEERVGSPLFIRKPRQVELTETGKALAAASTEAFRILAESFEQVRTGAQGTLSITTVLTFASNWLARHLGSFQIAHPSLAVRIDTSSHMVDFAREDVDIGIRSGNGNWPGLDVSPAYCGHFHADAQPKTRCKHRGCEGTGRSAAPAYPRSRRPLVDQWLESGSAVRRVQRPPGQQVGRSGL